MSAPKLLEAKPLDGYKIQLKFADGVTGKIDLSYLAGKGVFTFWEKAENFKKVTIQRGRWLEWPNEIDLDADALYLKVIGKKPEELFPVLQEETRA